MAWKDWNHRHGSAWHAKAGFVLWALKNAFMRKGLDPSQSGRSNFAKLAYLRALQGAPLSAYSRDALLIYHHSQAVAVSRSLWHRHTSGKIDFKFIPGDHSNWELVIHNTSTLVREQLKSFDARKADIEEASGATASNV